MTCRHKLLHALAPSVSVVSSLRVYMPRNSPLLSDQYLSPFNNSNVAIVANSNIKTTKMCCFLKKCPFDCIVKFTIKEGILKMAATENCTN